MRFSSLDEAFLKPSFSNELIQENTYPNVINNTDLVDIPTINKKTDVECSNFLSHYSQCPECIELFKKIEHFNYKNETSKENTINNIIIFLLIGLFLWILIKN